MHMLACFFVFYFYIDLSQLYAYDDIISNYSLQLLIGYIIAFLEQFSHDALGMSIL